MISLYLKYIIFMLSVCCVLWITVGLPDAQRLFVIIIKLDKQNVNLDTTTTLRYHGLEPKSVLFHVTLKELDYEMKIWRLSIHIYINMF